MVPTAAAGWPHRVACITDGKKEETTQGAALFAPVRLVFLQEISQALSLKFLLVVPSPSTTLLVSVIQWRHEQEPSAQGLTRTLP